MGTKVSKVTQGHSRLHKVLLKVAENVGLWMFLIGGCALVNGSPLIPSIVATVGLAMIYATNRKDIKNGVYN